jgi:EmrB/QacA subfamily drug resistance transporter
MKELSTDDYAEQAPPSPASRPAISPLVLPLLLMAEFMIQVDATIVNVALPTIKSDLGFTNGSLAWVVNGYVLAYGTLLLLGGRLADVLGRRTLLMIGITVFTVASALCAGSTHPQELVLSRVVEGVGGAIIAPAVLALIITMFPEGKARASALSAWGAAAACGSVFGSIIGGALTTGVGWRWVFIINLPIGAAVLLLAPRVMAASRSQRRPKLDPIGTGAITLALFALVYAVIGTETHGWRSAQTIALLVVSAVLLLVFVAVERRHDDPILPARLLFRRNTAGSIATTMLFGSAQLGCFFFVTLYLQQVLGYSALRTGLAYLPIMVGFGASSGIGNSLVKGRGGVRASLAIGLPLIAAGLFWLATVPVHGGFWTHIAGPTLITGLGLGLTYVPLSVAVTADADLENTGVASAMFTSSLMVGSAVGLAIFSTVSSSRTSALLAVGYHQLDALVGGFRLVFFIGGVLALVAMVLALSILRVASAQTAQK